MTQPIRVLIVEDDQYARNFMSQLIERDGRASVAGKIKQSSEIGMYLRRYSDIDLILLGGNPALITQLPDPLAESIPIPQSKPKLVYAIAHPEQMNISILNHSACQGCLFKGEIQFSLVWALILAARGEWVITPGVEGMAHEAHFAFNHDPVILEGSQQVAGMTAQEAEEARMAFLFYTAHPKITEHFSARLNQHIKITYRKLGFEKILQKSTNPRQYFTNETALFQYFGDQLEQMWGKTNNVQERASLAFSLLTIPKFHRYPSN